MCKRERASASIEYRGSGKKIKPKPAKSISCCSQREK